MTNARWMVRTLTAVRNGADNQPTQWYPLNITLDWDRDRRGRDSDVADWLQEMRRRGYSTASLPNTPEHPYTYRVTSARAGTYTAQLSNTAKAYEVTA